MQQVISPDMQGVGVIESCSPGHHRQGRAHGQGAGDLRRDPGLEPAGDREWQVQRLYLPLQNLLILPQTAAGVLGRLSLVRRLIP